MLERIARIEQMASAGKVAFVQSFMYQDTIIRNYEVIGEIAKRLPESLLQQTPEVPWSDLKGFRDFLSHNYDRVDLEIVWNAVQELPALRHAVETLLASLPPETDTP